jgi:hypothetical protein
MEPTENEKNKFVGVPIAISKYKTAQSLLGYHVEGSAGQKIRDLIFKTKRR